MLDLALFVVGVLVCAVCMKHKGDALRKGPSGVDQLPLWVSQLFRAAVALHEDLGVIHGDIKPGNLCEGDKGQIWFIDFEMSAVLRDGQSVADECFGQTNRYAAPEVLEDGLLSKGADVCSIGVTVKD